LLRIYISGYLDDANGKKLILGTMYLIEDSKLCPLNSLPPERFMRGLLYGDGVFESIYFHNERLFFYDDHLERLARGMAILGLQATLPTEAQIIKFLKTLQKNEDTLRIRLLIIREPGGLYTPTSDKAMVMLQIETSTKFAVVEQVSSGISVKAQLAPNQLSFCKTLNAIPYVMAGRERSSKGWGEILMTEGRNHEIAAAGSGNLIAYNARNQEFLMPGEASGVAAGIMRKNLVIALERQGYVVRDQAIPSHLLSELELASCNSFSVKFIESVDGENHETSSISKIIIIVLTELGLA
jgi:branched-chain amino acid aminotransferase/4-amino-4-deoxychorismate lyase